MMLNIWNITNLLRNELCPKGLNLMILLCHGVVMLGVVSLGAVRQRLSGVKYRIVGLSKGKAE